MFIQTLKIVTSVGFLVYFVAVPVEKTTDAVYIKVYNIKKVRG